MTPAKVRLFTLEFALLRIHMNHGSPDGSPCLRSPCAVTKPLKWAPSLIHKTLKSLWVKLRETLLSRPLRGYASSSVLLGQALWNSKTNENRKPF